LDYLKKQVVDAVLARVKQVEGDGIYIYDVYKEPPAIEVIKQVENLKLQLKVKTPYGPRFFEVIVKESY